MMLTIQIIYIVFFLLLVVGINVGLRRKKEKEKEKGVLHSKNRDIYIPRKSRGLHFSKEDDFLKLRN